MASFFYRLFGDWFAEAPNGEKQSEPDASTPQSEFYSQFAKSVPFSKCPLPTTEDIMEMSPYEVLNAMNDLRRESKCKDNEIEALKQQVEHEKAVNEHDRIERQIKTYILQREHKCQGETITYLAEQNDKLSTDHGELSAKLKDLENKTAPKVNAFVVDTKRYEARIEGLEQEVEDLKSMHKFDMMGRTIESVSNKNDALVVQNVQKDKVIKVQAQQIIDQGSEIVQLRLKHQASTNEARIKDEECRAKDNELGAKSEEIARLTAHSTALEKTVSEKDQAMHDLAHEKDLQIQDIIEQAKAQYEVAEQIKYSMEQHEIYLLCRLRAHGEIVYPHVPTIYGGGGGKTSLDEEMIDAGYDSGYDDVLDNIS